MSTPYLVAQQIAAILVAASVPALLGGAIVAMNAHTHQASEVLTELRADIQVQQPDKPPEKKRPPKVRSDRKLYRPARSKPAPRPRFSTQLVGLGGSVAVFSEEDLNQLDSDASSAWTDVRATPDLVMTRETVDTHPELIPHLCPMPQPPARAINRGLTGFVRVRALVTVDGRLDRIRVVEAQPEDLFEDAVLRALERWRLKPATYGGEPVAMSYEASFTFR